MYALFEKCGGTWVRLSDKTWNTREEAQRSADHLKMIWRDRGFAAMEVAVWEAEESEKS